MSRAHVLAFAVLLLAASPLLAAPAPTPKVPRELLEKRLETARKVYDQNLRRLRGGQGMPSELFEWSERILKAELALAVKQAERVAGYKAHLKRTRDVEKLTVNHFRVGTGRQSDADAATYFRIEAEIELFKATGKYEPDAGKKEPTPNPEAARPRLPKEEEEDDRPQPKRRIRIP